METVFKIIAFYLNSTTKYHSFKALPSQVCYFLPALADYKYLCPIKATAKQHK